MSNNKSLQDVANTKPGAFVSGSFSATLTNAQERQAKSGKAFYKAKITDGLVTIDVTSFSRSLNQYDGQQVTISGMGVKRGEDYNGQPQISLGDRVVITSTGAASIANPAAVGAPSAQPTVKTYPTIKVEGVTIGACMNKAVDICISRGDTTENAVWVAASALLRVQAKLSVGDLHVPQAEPISVDNGTGSEEEPY